MLSVRFHCIIFTC